MRLIYHGLLLSALCCCLLSCASPKMSQELEQGKVNFIAGDYKKAFHGLMPLAVNGNAQAAYAIGYMYYYGYGVAQDNESGLFWMRKSASQGFELAIQALNAIQQQSIKKDNGSLTPLDTPAPVAVTSKTEHVSLVLPAQSQNDDEVMAQMLAEVNKVSTPTLLPPETPSRVKVQLTNSMMAMPPKKLSVAPSRVIAKTTKINLKKSTCYWGVKNHSNQQLQMTRVHYVTAKKIS